MDRFLPKTNDLSELIQDQATLLYQQLQQVDVDALKLPYHCQEYFKSSHSTRLFFSIETSAHLLFRSISMTGKPVPEIVLMDYGAGVGTLFLLAKMIGCREVIYNDHLTDWKISAEIIATTLNINIDRFIVGDIEECMEELSRNNIDCDIIASRNVIEHIYRLDKFYSILYSAQPNALIFSSTTANYKNPGSRIKHRGWHRKWEKDYFERRKLIAGEIIPSADEQELNKLAFSTRGLGQEDLKDAIRNYATTKKLPDPEIHGTNTCEPVSGTWAEHIISFDEYRSLIREDQYSVHFAPGFWDTHYSKSYKNILSRFLNKIINAGGSPALMVAPFIYVIAKPITK